MPIVTVIGIDKVESFIKGVKGKPLFAKSFNTALIDYRKNLITQIKAKYTIRYNTDRVRSHIKTSSYTNNKPEASLIVKYAPTPLAHFYTEQVRIGKGNVETRVLPSTGIRYRQSAGSGSPYTKVQVRKGKGAKLKLVRGLKGYKGFLQHRKGHIYERKQQATWRMHQRLPYRPLFGLSVSQMASSQRVQTSGINKTAFTTVSKRFAKGVEELMK